MNRGELRLRVTQHIGLEDTAGELGEDLANDTIQEGVYDILTRTRLSMKCLDITLDPNEDLYDIPDVVLHMEGLYDDDGNRWKRINAPEQITDIGEFCLIGSDLIKIAPQDSALSLHCYYRSLPTAMTSDTHDPSDETYGGIPVQFHKAIVNYSCWRTAMVLEHPASQSGERFRLLYEGKDENGGDLRQIRKFINRHVTPTGFRRPPGDGYQPRNYI